MLREDLRGDFGIILTTTLTLLGLLIGFSFLAICSNVLIGWGARDAQAERGLLHVLPLVASIAFLLISDMDSPRHGIIHVSPQNLVGLADSLRTGHRETR